MSMVSIFVVTCGFVFPNPHSARSITVCEMPKEDKVTYVNKQEIRSIEEVRYFWTKDLNKAKNFNGPIDKTPMKGCKVTLKNNDRYYDDFSCEHLIQRNGLRE